MYEIKNIVSREAYKRLIEFEQLLLKWNKKINLISVKTCDSIMSRHVLDSLQLVQYLDKNYKIVDFGSGAGFPGVILSIAGIKDVTLIESDSRKVAFLLQAAKLSDNKITIINDRIETLNNLDCDLFTSRAFSELNSILEYGHQINHKAKFLLHKGARYKNEVSIAQKHWLFKICVHDSITSKTGKILEISDLERLQK